MEEPPLVRIEVIEERDNVRIIEALVAEPLTDVGPVFLFDVSVVIFVVGTGASKLYGALSLCEMSEEVIIKELAAIITIEAEQREGQRFFNVFDLFEDVGFPFSPDGSLFRPAGGNVNAVKGIGEHTGEGLAAMGDGVSFEKTGAGFIPLVGFDRDMFSDQGSRFSGRSAPFFIFDSSGKKESVDGGRRDREEGLRGL